MQPDYNELWRNMNNNQTPDTHFYTFFEDSLNQFISNNSHSSALTVNENEGQMVNKLKIN